MAGEGEPAAKKLKQDFSINDQDLFDLKLAISSCVKIPCRCLKFSAANAANKYQSYSFSQAYCDTTVCEDQKTKRKEEYAFGSFFDDGLELLQNFTKDPSKFLESSSRENNLLLRLLEFLRNEGKYPVSVIRLDDPERDMTYHCLREFTIQVFR